MKATLIDTMGNDITVVNAARVSFDRESDWEFYNKDNELIIPTPYHTEDWDIAIDAHLSERDQKLINYLAKHNHWTPFSHVMITMREEVPIFVARQRFKHMVGFTYNEVSRRYVDTPPEFFYPDEWRGKPINAKQGSSDEVIHMINDGEMTHPDDAYRDFLVKAHELYNFMLSAGVAPEQARMILPQSMMTSYYVTGSLAAWARAYKLRSDEHSQKEIQDLAKQWNDIISDIPELKYSWEALTSN